MSEENASHFDVHEAQANLSRIIERVEHGDQIIISRAGRPVAKIVSVSRHVDRRGRGSLRGQLLMAPIGTPTKSTT